MKYIGSKEIFDIMNRKVKEWYIPADLFPNIVNKMEKKGNQ